MKGLICLFAIALTIGACGEDGDDGETGELGRGTFYYECVSELHDAACGGTANPPAFPSAIAVGAWFDMTFIRKSDDGGASLRVIEGSGNHIAGEAGALSMQRSGYTALLAVAGATEAVDIVHVFGQIPARLAVVATKDVGSITQYHDLNRVTLQVGDILQLRAIVEDSLGRTLAGVLRYDWTIVEGEIATLAMNTGMSVIRVQGMKEGTTELIIQTGNIVRQIPIEVTPGDVDGGIDTDLDSGPDEDAGTGEDRIVDVSTGVAR
ncbi:MAG: hypothetical protein QNJ97_16300 [Myxococcota bacterium]|nr:hypothetical protein [Myxococcota bacterium]